MRRSVLLVSVAALFLTACTRAERSGSARPPTPSTASTSSEASPRGSGAAEVRLRPVAEGLESPVGVVDAPDDARTLYVIEQPGRVVTVGSGSPVTVLDITDRITSGGEQGLLGLAFHPRFPSEPYLYVNYTDLAGDTVIARYTGEDGRFDPRSESVLLQIDQPYPNHNGGHLAFGPDGLLYIGMGDGGAAGDPEDRAQDPSQLLGKMLRLDVDEGGRYGIPDGNHPGAAPEVWAVGLRNPWRFTFDRATGDLWIGDVGQGEWEEVNRVDPEDRGLNFGWDDMEGDDCFEPSEGCARGGRVRPVYTYSHDEGGCSVTGGPVYRGTGIRGLVGTYLFGDYCQGDVWGLDPEEGRRVVVAELDVRIASFGEDERGEVYVVDHGGRVLKLVAQ